MEQPIGANGLNLARHDDLAEPESAGQEQVAQDQLAQQETLSCRATGKKSSGVDAAKRDAKTSQKSVAAKPHSNESVAADPALSEDRPAQDTDAQGKFSQDMALSNVTELPSADRRERLRILEALLFAASQPLQEKQMAEHLRDGEDVLALLEELQGFYAGRGVNLVKVAGKWAFRTAEDLAFLLERHATQQRRLSKAALETLSIIAYHQPVTRAEIEEIRGVQTSSGTLDVLMETAWVRPRGRRRAPGRPITYGTTPDFLEHFSLDSIKDLPGLAELKGAGLLDSNLPPGFEVPAPQDVAALMPDEMPLEEDEEETADLPFGEFEDDAEHLDEEEGGDGEGAADAAKG